jgi:hypothetical protein
MSGVLPRGSSPFSRSLYRASSRAEKTLESRLWKSWSLEKQFTQEFEKIILLLASSEKWEQEDEQFLFAEDADIECFNIHLNTIQKIVQGQELLQKACSN